jgi:hypothetical protein
MQTRTNKFLLITFLLLGMQAAGAADKNITIDGDLAAGADMLNEYAGLGSPTRDRSRNEFSFVLGNKTSNVAEVNAIFRAATTTRTSRNLPDVILDRDEVLKNAHEFAAEITTSNNKEAEWDLMLAYAEGTRVAAQDDGVLTNGSRSFAIVATSSAKDGSDSRSFPALGYEFLEDGVSRAAVQYFGGGAFGFNKNIIWLGADLDPDMKLVLAAAMAAILQVKIRAD